MLTQSLLTVNTKFTVKAEGHGQTWSKNILIQ